MQDFNEKAEQGNRAEPFTILVTEIGSFEKRKLDVSKILVIKSRENGGSVITVLLTDDPKGEKEDIVVQEGAKELVEIINADPSDEEKDEWERQILRERQTQSRRELQELEGQEERDKEQRQREYEENLRSKKQAQDKLRDEAQEILDRIQRSPKVKKYYDLFERVHEERGEYGYRAQKSRDGFIKGRSSRQWDKVIKRYEAGKLPELALVLSLEEKKRNLLDRKQEIARIEASRESYINQRNTSYEFRRDALRRQLENPYMTHEDRVRLQKIIDGYKKEHGAPEEFRFREKGRSQEYRNIKYDRVLKLEEMRERVRREYGEGPSLGRRRSRGYGRER